MKYIKLLENFNKSDLESELYRYGIEKYTINSDGTIDVDGDVNLNNSGLTKIPFKFGKVFGDFFCSHNRLISLEGSPSYVGGNFYCANNDLTDLVGAPIDVDGKFYCNNNKLTSLVGMPFEIGWNFNCCYNNLKELDSVSNIEGHIQCDDNVDTTKFQGYCEKIILRGGRNI